MDREGIEKALDEFSADVKADLTALGEETKREMQEFLESFVSSEKAECKKCVHVDLVAGIWHCRRGAPESKDGKAVWPKVRHNDRCGEFSLNLWSADELESGQSYRRAEGRNFVRYHGIVSRDGLNVHRFEGPEGVIDVEALNQFLEPKWGPR